jgi:hypothetical protein
MSVPAGAYFAVGAGKTRWELDNAAHGFAREKPTLEPADHCWFYSNESAGGPERSTMVLTDGILGRSR